MGIFNDEAPKVYQLGKKYVSGKGVVFTIFEAPRKRADRPGYWIGPAMFEDGTVDAFMWGPATRPLRPWWLRILFRIFGPAAPPLPVPATYEAIVDAQHLPPATSPAADSKEHST